MMTCTKSSYEHILEDNVEKLEERVAELETQVEDLSCSNDSYEALVEMIYNSLILFKMGHKHRVNDTVYNEIDWKEIDSLLEELYSCDSINAQN